MKESNCDFNLDNIQSVELNLLNGQVEIILRALELYGYNLEYMLDSTDATNDTRQEKIALIKYTYEQVLATQAEQVNGKSDNIDNLSSLGKNETRSNVIKEKIKKVYDKNLIKEDNIVDIIPKENKFNVI